MKDTPIGQKATTAVVRPWPPEQGEWTYEDWLKLPDEGAIALYRQEEISFARAAELCGLSQEELKHILAARGIFCEVAPLEQDVFEQAAEALRRAGA